jgi:hypothetical protein
VLDNYAAVMPLTHAKKLGVSYLYQPYFTQQLGVFAPEGADTSLVNAFLEHIPKKYRYISIQLKKSNLTGISRFPYTSRCNCTLDLTPGYDVVSRHYHRNCRRNLQKAVHARLSIQSGSGSAAFARFIKRNLRNQLSDLRKTFYPLLQSIVQASLENQTGMILFVKDPGNEKLAAGWFVLTPKRCTFLVCASTPKGKANQAAYFLVDYMIRILAGTPMVFDFAGSDHQGIRYFNLSFGATASPYPLVHINSLPWPLSFFKA